MIRFFTSNYQKRVVKLPWLVKFILGLLVLVLIPLILLFLIGFFLLMFIIAIFFPGKRITINNFSQPRTKNRPKDERNQIEDIDYEELDG